jgi:dolichyl-phosphate-mannose-protein mannosyltransferase
MHHYFPALYFGVLTIGIVFDMFTFRMKPYGRVILAGIIMAASLYIFIQFAPISYGTELSKEQCEKLKWSKKWDLSWYFRSGD